MFSGIVPKIDWFSAVYKDYTIQEIASLYRIDVALPAYMEHSFSTSIGGTEFIAYDWMGCKWFISNVDLSAIDPAILSTEGIFHVRFPKIKFDLSGLALEYLRHHFFEGVNSSDTLDSWLRVPQKDVVATRLDVAFDFVNYKPELFHDMAEWVKYQESQGNYRLLCAGLPSGLTYSLRMGDQSTLYLGSTGCDKLLRVYDKKRQFYDPVKNIWTVPESSLSYGFVESWNRIEFQLRRQPANDVLYNEYLNDADFYKCVLQLVFKRYAFRDPSVSIDHKAPVIMPFWLSLTPEWDRWMDLIPIKNFVESEPYIKKATSYIENTAFRAIFTYIAIYGVDGFLLLLQNVFDRIQKGVDVDGEFLNNKLRWLALQSALVNSGCSSLSDCKGLIQNSDGSYSFNFNYHLKGVS